MQMAPALEKNQISLGLATVDPDPRRPRECARKCRPHPKKTKARMDKQACCPQVGFGLLILCVCYWLGFFRTALIFSFSQLPWRLSKVKTNGPLLLGMSVNLFFCYTCFRWQMNIWAPRKSAVDNALGVFEGCFHLFISFERETQFPVLPAACQ